METREIEFMGMVSVAATLGLEGKNRVCLAMLTRAVASKTFKTMPQGFQNDVYGSINLCKERIEREERIAKQCAELDFDDFEKSTAIIGRICDGEDNMRKRPFLN